MAENELQIKVVEKNGNTYHNLDLRDMGDGDSIIVEKLYEGGIKMPDRYEGQESYAIKAEYNGEKVSFFLNDIERNGFVVSSAYTDFKECGGIGSKVRISTKKEIYKDKKGTDRVKTTFSFEEVE